MRSDSIDIIRLKEFRLKVIMESIESDPIDSHRSPPPAIAGGGMSKHTSVYAVVELEVTGRSHTEFTRGRDVALLASEAYADERQFAVEVDLVGEVDGVQLDFPVGAG